MKATTKGSASQPQHNGPFSAPLDSYNTHLKYMRMNNLSHDSYGSENDASAVGNGQIRVKTTVEVV